MKVLIVCLALIASASALQSRRKAKVDCKAELTKSDECLKKLTFIYNATVPSTMAQLDELYCSEVPNLVSCVSKTRSCYNNFKRTLFNLVSKNMRIFFTRQCKTSASKKNLLRHLKCVDNPGSNSPVNIPIEKALREYVVVTQLASTQKSQDDTIPTMCCGYEYQKERIQKHAVGYCKERGINFTERHFFAQLLDNVLGDAADLICGKYTSVANCKTYWPEGLAAIMATGESGDIKDPGFFVVTALTNFLEVMDNNLNS